MKVPVIVSALVLLLLSPAAIASSAPSPQGQKECVVLLHGLWRSSLSMKALQWGLEEAGFDVVNPTYPSLSHSIQELAVMAVSEGLAGCRERGLRYIHFVTHSLGGILVRQYLSDHVIPGLRRVVMLGPPNQGSQVADYVHSLELLQALTPQAVEQLGTGENSVPRQLGPVNFELGVIAGTAQSASLFPASPEGASDGTVAVTETLVPGMLDFIALPVGHSFMMWNEAVVEQVVHFLIYGRFRRGVGG